MFFALSTAMILLNVKKCFFLIGSRSFPRCLAFWGGVGGGGGGCWLIFGRFLCFWGGSPIGPSRNIFLLLTTFSLRNAGSRCQRPDPSPASRGGIVGGVRIRPKPYKSIGFGAMDVPRPYEVIGCGAMDVPKPYEFIGFGTMDVTKPHGCPQTL